MQLTHIKANATQCNISLKVNRCDTLHDGRAVDSRTVPIGTIVPMAKVRANSSELTQVTNSCLEHVDKVCTNVVGLQRVIRDSLGL